MIKNYLDFQDVIKKQGIIDKGKSQTHRRKKQILFLNFFYPAFWYLFFLTFFVLSSGASCLAATATVSWDKNPEPDIKGYKIYYGTSSGNYDNNIWIDSPDQTSYVFDNLQEGNTYYFAVTAVDLADQESELSDEVSKAIPISNHAPTASFTADPVSGTSPLDVSLDASGSSDPDEGDTLSYAWNFGDGSTGSGVSVSHTFQDPGSFTVTLTVTDSHGLSDTKTLTIAAEENQKPKAQFSSNKTQAFIPADFEFDASASSDPDGHITSYDWDFGDGSTGSGQTASHVFDTEGSYTVSLTVTDDKGATDSTSITVTAIKGYTYTWKIGEGSDAQKKGVTKDTHINVNSENYSSSSLLRIYTWPSSEPANSIIMKWDLGFLPQGSEIKSADLKLYMAEMEGDGGDDTVNISVHKIINVDPVVEACTGMTYDGQNQWTPNSVRNDGVPMAQGDIDQAEDTKAVNKSPQFITWNVTKIVQQWQENPAENFGLLLNPGMDSSSDTNRYFASSEYDDETKRPELVITFVTPEPLNSPPSAKISASSLQGQAPVTIDLSGTQSTDPDGSITSYHWTIDNGAQHDGPEWNYEFTEAGTFHVTLTVTDDKGATATDSITITISENSAPTADIQADKLSGKAPLTVNLDGSGSNDSDGEITSWSWNFGDGDTAQGQTVSHEFSAGTHEVTLTVTDNNGATGTATVTIDVESNSAPVITDFHADKTNVDNPPWKITFYGTATDEEDGTPELSLDFGDGNTADTLPAQHTYSKSGTYEAVLTATDKDGNSVNKTLTIVVENKAPGKPTNVKVTLNQ